MRYIALLAFASLLVAIPSHAAPRAESKTQTIRLVSNIVQVRILRDTAPKGEPNKGDQVWGKSRLRNDVAQFGKPKGAVVGSDVVVETMIAQNRSHMKVTVTLPGGTISLAGEVKRNMLPVVGGTGAFAGARGTCEVRALAPDGDPTLNIYRLRLP